MSSWKAERPGRGWQSIVMLLVLGLSLAAASGASAALFLQIGDIKGDSTEITHEDWSVILTVDWGVSVATVFNPGSGSTVGKPVFKNLSWTQEMDRSIAPLFDALVNGDFIQKALVDFTYPGGDEGAVTYFQMEFRDVFLTNLDVQGTASSRATVAGELSYNFIKMTYTSYDESGKKVPITAEYNRITGEGSLGALAMLYGRGLNGPEIDNVVPVPASLLLLGSGLMGLAGWRWKNRK